MTRLEQLIEKATELCHAIELLPASELQTSASVQASALRQELAEIVGENPVPYGVRRCVLQNWVQELTFMQQSVLMAAVRGPDGIRKDHPVKVLCRWLRRSFLLSAFDRRPLLDPLEEGGGSFTGKCHSPEVRDIDHALEIYLRTVDELPHHFQLHFLHAAEILGYKHPREEVRAWWRLCYSRLVNDAHLFPESEAQMDARLGDYEAGWRAREEVVAQ